MRSLSVVVPAFNEEQRLPATLEHLSQFLRIGGYDGEIIVVDDGSFDRTAQIVQEFSKDHQETRLLQLDGNQGPGRAVRAGILSSTKEHILYTDADLSTPIEQIDLLWEALVAGRDIVMGSRRLQKSTISVPQPPTRRIAGRVFATLVAILCVRGFKDTQCGFKLFRREPAQRIFKRIRTRRFTFNVEMLLFARAAGLRIGEVPVHWQDVRGSRVQPLQESLRTLVEILRIRGILPWGSG